MTTSGTDAERARFATVLKAYVGPEEGKRATVGLLSMATAIPAATLYSYLDGSRLPGFSHTKKLVGFIGGAFASHLFEDVNIAACEIPGAHCQYDAIATLGEAIGAVAAARRDNPPHVAREIERKNVGPSLMALGAAMVRA